MKALRADTLALRLFLLMWAALVASHALAFFAVRTWHAPPRPPAGAMHAPPPFGLPTFPSLPPMPGLPAQALLLDYGIRLVVIALAAWFGSRWLAAPVRRLVAASRTLGASVAGAGPLPALDEHAGTREVREAAQVFNTMAQQLREQFQGRGLMIAAISHDLRTPLTRVRMRLEGMTAEPELQQRCVADIQEMNALIDNVLEVFRGGPGADEALQRTDIAALVQSIADDGVEQGQPVSFASAGPPAVTLAQPAALRRVVGNLLGNSLRYGQRAELRVLSDAQAVRIQVDDHGPGIAPGLLEAVFQPFYRVDASRSRQGGGTGLGLYIARDLTQRQGGELRLFNRPEGGLRAEVRLPWR